MFQFTQLSEGSWKVGGPIVYHHHYQFTVRDSLVKNTILQSQRIVVKNFAFQILQKILIFNTACFWWSRYYCYQRVIHKRPLSLSRSVICLMLLNNGSVSGEFYFHSYLLWFSVFWCVKDYRHVELYCVIVNSRFCSWYCFVYVQL